MRVLMLNYEYPPLGGGGSNACKYLLREMANKGIEVDLVTSSPSNKFETEKIGDTVSIYKLPVNKKDIHYWTQREIMSYSWKAKKFIDKLMNEKEYDVCHAFFTVPCGAVAYLFRKKIPYIVSLRGSDVPGFNKRFGFQYIFLKPLIKKIWTDAKAVVANSQGLKELALNTSPSQEIGVIYNGIDVSEFEPNLDSTIDDEDSTNDNEIRVVCVSRLIERKGINYLIEAIEKLKDKQIQLILVGEGKQEDTLKKLVDDLKISDKVDFKGYVDHDQIAEIYRNSDIFVLPSLNEGMSNALLEALAAGLPVIVTDTGGTSELLDGNGVLIPMADSDAIAEAIRGFVDEPEERRQMGLKSREIAEGMSWMRVGEEYLRLYEELG